MTRRPFDPGELGTPDPELGRVASELESYARLTANETPGNLADRVMADVTAEPEPRAGFLAALLGPLGRWPHSNVARAMLVGATMAAAILAVIVAGELAGLFQNNQVGPSPEPTVIESPSLTPSPTPETTVEPSPSPTQVPSVTVRPSPSAVPTAEPSDSETPEPQTVKPTESPDDHGSETPRPSEDSSGPGGDGSDDESA